VSSRKLLIVNADDFGLTDGVNRGVVEAHERGIVTSASVMVNRPGAGAAAEYGRRRSALSLGLHVELDRSRLARWGRRTISPERAAAELDAQLETFRRLVGREPTHLDSHHHRHRDPALRDVFEARARELQVPLRHVDARVRFCGDFYGHDGGGRPDHDAIASQTLIRLLQELEPGITELGCHPGYPDGLRSWYRDEREQEVRSLCDSRVRVAAERVGIELVSFAALDRDGPWGVRVT
jgi:chitin disaccharide deacetylase